MCLLGDASEGAVIVKVAGNLMLDLLAQEGEHVDVSVLAYTAKQCANLKDLVMISFLGKKADRSD